MDKPFWQETSETNRTGFSQTREQGGQLGQLGQFGRAEYGENLEYEYSDAFSQKREDTERQWQHDLQFLAESVQGRRFLKYLLDFAGIFDAMPVGSKDIYAYYEGRRSMGLMLYHGLYGINPRYLIDIQGEK